MELSEVGKHNLRAFLVQVYGPQANTWVMTPVVADLTFRLLAKSAADNDLTDNLQARLAPGQSSTRWLSQHAVEAVLHKLATRKYHYAAAVKSAAYDMKSAFRRKGRAG